MSIKFKLLVEVQLKLKLIKIPILHLGMTIALPLSVVIYHPNVLGFQRFRQIFSSEINGHLPEAFNYFFTY